MKSRLASLWRALREFAGDDAYERYLRHYQPCAKHPRLTRREFFAQREERKWSGIQRCC
jgi:uncharacterized short protein YbdD (DUF466 family)